MIITLNKIIKLYIYNIKYEIIENYKKRNISLSYLLELILFNSISTITFLLTFFLLIVMIYFTFPIFIIIGSIIGIIYGIKNKKWYFLLLLLLIALVIVTYVFDWLQYGMIIKTKILKDYFFYTTLTSFGLTVLMDLIIFFPLYGLIFYKGLKEFIELSKYLYQYIKEKLISLYNLVKDGMLKKYPDNNCKEVGLIILKNFLMIYSVLSLTLVTIFIFYIGFPVVLFLFFAISTLCCVRSNKYIELSSFGLIITIGLIVLMVFFYKYDWLELEIFFSYGTWFLFFGYGMLAVVGLSIIVNIIYNLMGYWKLIKGFYYYLKSGFYEIIGLSHYLYIESKSIYTNLKKLIEYEHITDDKITYSPLNLLYIMLDYYMKILFLSVILLITVLAVYVLFPILFLIIFYTLLVICIMKKLAATFYYVILTVIFLIVTIIIYYYDGFNINSFFKEKILGLFMGYGSIPIIIISIICLIIVLYKDDRFSAIFFKKVKKSKSPVNSPVTIDPDRKSGRKVLIKDISNEEKDILPDV